PLRNHNFLSSLRGDFPPRPLACFRGAGRASFWGGVAVYHMNNPPRRERAEKRTRSRTANKVTGRTTMSHRRSIGAIALFAALFITVADSQAWDDKLYPDFGGQWRPLGGVRGVFMSVVGGAGGRRRV